MKKIIKAALLKAVKLLLWLFAFSFMGCGSLKDVKSKELSSGENILQLAVNESEFSVFNQRIQALGLVAIDFRPAITDFLGSENNEFWVTFRFVNQAALMRSHVSLTSIGFIRRISYPYR